MAIRVEKVGATYLKLAKVLGELRRALPVSSVAIDLGCGTQPRNPLGAAVLRGADIMPRDILQSSDTMDFYDPQAAGAPFTYGENFADVVYAFDFLEHIPRHAVRESGFGEFVEVMNDIWRVLKPNGVLVAATPYFPRASAFSDPTHVNFITKQTHRYFSGDEWARTNGYGFTGSFEPVLIQTSKPSIHPSLWGRSSPRPPDVLQAGANTFRAVKGLLGTRSHLIWILKKRKVGTI